MKRVWDRPGHRERVLAAAREYWSPERKAARSMIERRCTATQAELKARSEMAAARMKKLWINMPERKAILSARMTAHWKDPEMKDVFLKNRIFRRDDDNPKMKAAWEKMGASLNRCASTHL